MTLPSKNEIFQILSLPAEEQFYFLIHEDVFDSYWAEFIAVFFLAVPQSAEAEAR